MPWVVVEERLHGPEASLIALCDGRTAVALPLARDHKRLRDGDDGPNTGGMGAYSPLPDLSDEAAGDLLSAFHRPILAELARRGTPFRGALYAGLMLTDDGPVLLECNARFGDPETQAIMPRLAGALGPILLAAARGDLTAAVPGTVLANGSLPVVPGRHRRHRARRRRLPGRDATRRRDRRARRCRRGRRPRLPRRHDAGTATGRSGPRAGGCSRSSGEGPISMPLAAWPTRPRSASTRRGSSAGTTSATGVRSGALAR